MYGPHRFKMWTKQLRTSVSAVSHATRAQNCTNFDSIDKINKILVGKLHYSSIPPNTLEGLDTFCEEFLSCTCCEDHEVATKLAKLSIFLYLLPQPYPPEDYQGSGELIIEDLARGVSIYSIYHEKKETEVRQELESEGRPITPAIPIQFSFLRRKFNKNVLEEGHRADIPRFNFKFGRRDRIEGMVIALRHLSGSLCPRPNVHWWQEDRVVKGEPPLGFHVSYLPIAGAEFCWIEPANVITYLGLIPKRKHRYISGIGPSELANHYI